MKEIHVQLGHSSKNPEEHCFDGDSSYITGSVKDKIVRLLGIDALEVRGLNLYYLEKSGFLNRLDYNLRKHLEPKLTRESIGIHKNLGFEAKDFFESILKEDLILSFEREAFDRYERLLVYLSVVDQDTYNLKLVQTGYALPYFIYPNAVSPTEEGEFTYDTIEKFQDAAVKAKRTNLGIWEYINRILLPMELRFLTRREPPVKYCADLERNLLYSPQYYFKVPIENRLFFYPKDVLVAVQKKFRPTSDCDGWLHEVWRVLREKEKRKEK